jgi:hypothetical protein
MTMRINKYFPFAFIYFFVNSLALPFGLTYTAILSPLLYWWVITTRKKEILLPFFVCLAPFSIMHLIGGVELKSFFISILNFAAVYIFCQAFYTFLKECSDPENIFRKLLIINFVLCIIAIPLYFTSWYSLVWMENSLTEGVNNFLRLKLFTYEASYYATIFTPLFFFYLLQVLLRQNKINSWLLLVMLFLPYVLSFSIGAITSVLVAAIITYLCYFKRLTRKRRVLSVLMVSGVALVTVLAVLLLFFPANTLFVRIANIFSGHDTSGKGRTSDAFILAKMILEKKNELWGVGPGQIKILGADIIRSYYLYDLDYPTITIPNAAAETLTIFGWLGFCARILIEVALFFYTKVWTNYYRLLLFLFIFLYQFTGSFITNLAEYVIWIIAFTKAFPQFNVQAGNYTSTIEQP